MIDCAQCCYNACVIPSCMSLNAALLTTDQRLQAILGQRRAQMNTVQMKEYVRLGKIGLLSSCEHMGEYFWFNKCTKSCLWTNTWLSYCNKITHHKAHGEETRHSGTKIWQKQLQSLSKYVYSPLALKYVDYWPSLEFKTCFRCYRVSKFITDAL